MKILEKVFIGVLIVIISIAVTGFLISVALDLFGNPLDRKNIRNIAEQYLAANYNEYNPRIIDIDRDVKYGGYRVEILLEKSQKRFNLKYYDSGEMELDSYNFSEYEKKYGEAYYQEGLYAIRDIIGTPQNEKQKAVLAVINFDCEIQNGGLAQYLVNEDNENIVKITDYLRMIGLEEQAKLLETFTAENDIELKSVEVNSIDEHIEFEQSKPFDEFNSEYMDIYKPADEWEPGFEGLIVSYIQENIEDF